MNSDWYGVVTPAAEDPVTITEVKAWCKITHSSEDALLSALIATTTSELESFTNRVFVQRTFTGMFSSLECSKFEKGLYLTIRRAPLGEVTEVKVTEDGAEETVSTDDYAMKETSGFSRVVFSEVNNSPDDIPYPWQVDFTAGYGAASDVPEAIKTAIKQYVCFLYSNRGDCADQCGGGGTALPPVVRAMVSPYRILNTFGC